MAPQAFIEVAYAAADTSVGAVGLVLALLVLVAILVTVIAIEVAGEHRANVAHRRQHHR